MTKFVKKEKKIVTTVRLPKSLLTALARKAASEGRSRSSLIEHSLRKVAGKEKDSVLD